MSSRPTARGDWWIHLLAEFVTRLIYGLIPVLGLIFGAARGGAGHVGGDVTLFWNPVFWLFAGTIGLISAIIGPQVYRRHAHRGRGSLVTVRRRSKKRR